MLHGRRVTRLLKFVKNLSDRKSSFRYQYQTQVGLCIDVGKTNA